MNLTSLFDKSCKTACTEKGSKTKKDSTPTRHTPNVRSGKERSQVFRDQLSDEQRKQYNKSACKRMNRLREKTKGSKIVTKASHIKQRQEWRDAKKQSRSRLTTPQKKDILEKRRKLYKNKKVAQCPESHHHIPSTPEKFASYINKLVTDATPRKKEALKKYCFPNQLLENAKDHLSELKKTKGNRQKMKHIVHAFGTYTASKKLTRNAYKYFEVR